MRTPSPLLIAAFAILCGCVIDALIKEIATHASVLMLTSWRFIFGAMFALTLYTAAKKPMPSLRAIRFHTMRGAVQVTAALSFFWSLTQLGLTEATVIGFTAALMIAPIARIILGEAFSKLSIIAILVGFAGAVFTISTETVGAPEGTNRTLGAAAAFLAAFAYALTIVLMRLRSREEDTLTIVMFSNVMPAIILLPFLLATEPVPPVSMLPVFAMMGFFGMSVWWMFTIAYANAPAQRLAPLEYTSLIWSAALGYVFFQEIPGWRLYVGSAVIIGACLLIAFESHYANRREARMPVSVDPD
ncbi:MAG: DMT family transporter [Hyphomonadaceae bacterium]